MSALWQHVEQGLSQGDVQHEKDSATANNTETAAAADSTPTQGSPTRIRRQPFGSMWSRPSQGHVQHEPDFTGRCQDLSA